MYSKKNRQLTRVKYFQIVITIVYVLFFISFFTFKVANFSNKIDGSWGYSISGLKHSTQHLSKEIFFTYGPLSEKIITAVNTNDTVYDYIQSLILISIILLFVTIVFYKFVQIVFEQTDKDIIYLALVTIVATFISITSLESFFYLTLLITLYVCSQEKHYYKKILYLLGILILSLYKFNFTLPTLILSPLVFIDYLSVKRIVKGVILWIPVLLLYALFFLILTGVANIAGFIKYIYFGLLTSLAYTEFMNLPYGQHNMLLAIFTVFFVANFLVFIFYCITLYRRKTKIADDKFIIMSLAYLPIVYFAYKYSITRFRLSFSTFILLSFAYFVLSVFILYPRIKENKYLNSKVILFVFSLLTILFCASQMILVVRIQEYNQIGIKTIGIQNYLKSRLDIIKDITTQNQLNYTTFLDKRAATRVQNEILHNELAESTNNLVNRGYEGDLIFYGNSTMYAEALKKDFKVLYMPYLQTYASFPPRILDNIYIDYLNKHPDALVFAEEYEPSIDERIPSHELNNFFQYLTQNYELVSSNSTKKQFIYKRISNSKESCQQISSTKTYDNYPVIIPDASISENEYIKLKATSTSIVDSLTDSGLGMFLKKPVLNIGLINKDGTFSRRTTRSTLEHGISVKPLYMSLEQYNSNEPYKLSSIIINDNFPTQSDYLVEFEKCEFK